jgi:hypothetical protein
MMRWFRYARLVTEFGLCLAAMYWYLVATQPSVGLVVIAEPTVAHDAPELSSARAVFELNAGDVCLVWHGKYENSVVPIECLQKGFGWIPNRIHRFYWSSSRLTLLEGRVPGSGVTP